MYKAIKVIGIAGLVAAAMTSLTQTETSELESGPPPIRIAQAAQPTLPGGASSLSETYKDWQVSCVQQGTARRCVMTQQQINAQNRQRVLAIEINASTGGKDEGTLVLPFGLMLDAGIKLQIDDGASGPAIRYRTCLASGVSRPREFRRSNVSQPSKGHDPQGAGDGGWRRIRAIFALTARLRSRAGPHRCAGQVRRA